MQEIKQYASSLENNLAKTNGIKANNVVIMSESLWDLANLKLEEKVDTYIPNIFEDQVGHFLNPQYGGGTTKLK